MDVKKKIGLIFGVTVGCLILVFLGMMFYQHNRYRDCWYEGTVINGIDVSGQSAEEAKRTAADKFQNFAVTIRARNNGYLVIKGNDIGLSFEIGTEWDELFEKQHEGFSFSHTGGENEISFNISYNKEELKKRILQSKLIKNDKSYKIRKPVSAYAKYDKNKKQYVCVEEIQGNTIHADMLIKAVEGALKQAKSEIDITNEKTYPEIYEKPEVTSESAELVKEINLCNNSAIRFIQFNLGKKINEIITPKQISRWLTYKEGKIIYDNKAIGKWVEKFCAKYTTVGKTRSIRSHTGKKVKVYGGDYGWLVNDKKTLKQVKEALNAKIGQNVTDAYISNPDEDGKKALTIRKKVSYYNTAHNLDFGTPVNDWDKKNYTEISLTEQKVYVFRKGKVAFSCRCITGRPVKDRITRTGAYYIKEHRPEYTMTGDDYSTHVKHWVRITWTGTGFHPATWQPWSRWNKNLYKTKGSHGCINLSPADAEKIYTMLPYREAVFIHA